MQATFTQEIQEKQELLNHLGITLGRVDNIDLEKLEVKKYNLAIRIKYGRFHFALILNEDKGMHLQKCHSVINITQTGIMIWHSF